MKSIIQKDNRCFLCGSTRDLQTHHCQHGYNRNKADEDGLTVRLCVLCHTNLHSRGWGDRELKQISQTMWERTYGSREDFIRRYGKSYL